MKSALLVVLFVFLFLWYLNFSATRLDRLHHRVETSWANLDGLLQRRAAIALELARSELADPASSLLLTDAAYQAREAPIAMRSQAESGLSSALRHLRVDMEAVAKPAERSLLTELSELTGKIQVAIALHVDSVNSTRVVRQKLIFKIFRLAGRAPLPVTYEFEDDVL
ncbi:MAG: hypothetical protein HY050_07650 [Actinobacteria bacterium]|nr:hypothetical protein [Actinomycetota bacterium]